MQGRAGSHHFPWHRNSHRRRGSAIHPHCKAHAEDTHPPAGLQSILRDKRLQKSLWDLWEDIQVPLTPEPRRTASLAWVTVGKPFGFSLCFVRTAGGGTSPRPCLLPFKGNSMYLM